MRIKKTVLCLLIMGIAAGLSAEEIEKSETKKYRLSPRGSISLMADDGYISVRVWDRNEVVLKMTKRAWGRNRKEAERNLEDIRVRIQERSDRLVIKEMPMRNEVHFNFFDLFDGDYWRDRRWRRSSIDFELTVPEEAALKLQCDEGSVDVIAARGELIIDVDEGDITLEDIGSDAVQLFADEGSIRISRMKADRSGYLKIDVDEGDIRLENSEVEEININADEGNIILRDVLLKRCWLSTDEGDIEADTRPMESSSYRLETDEGRIILILPADAGLSVRMEAEEGRIHSEFNLNIFKHDDGQRAEGVIGSRGGTLKVFTSEGDIELLKR